MSPTRPPSVRYRSVTHVALRVPDLRQAEEFYLALFDLQVAFREASVSDGWRTLPEGAGWEDARAAGIDLGLSVLRRDALGLALERAEEGVAAGGLLSHVGLETTDAELRRLRQVAPGLGCRVVLDRPGSLLLDDPYGVRWELTTAHELRSTGAATGRWLDVPDRPGRTEPPVSSTGDALGSSSST